MEIREKMSIEKEISRLLDLMPASGRMSCKIISQPQQGKVIATTFPPPWQPKRRPININFDLWRKLPTSQRDLLLLRSVSLLLGVKWFKPDIYQAVTVVALLGFIFELTQGDGVGIVMSGALMTLAANQIWQKNRSLEKELKADEEAIKIAVRRGYTEKDASISLMEAIEAMAELESYRGLDFIELMRLQNLRKLIP